MNFDNIKLEDGTSLTKFLKDNCLMIWEDQRAQLKKFMKEYKLELEIYKYELEKLMQEKNIPYKSIKYTIEGDYEDPTWYILWLRISTPKDYDYKRWNIFRNKWFEYEYKIFPKEISKQIMVGYEV